MRPQVPAALAQGFAPWVTIMREAAYIVTLVGGMVLLYAAGVVFGGMHILW
jgi:hypothetical protein